MKRYEIFNTIIIGLWSEISQSRGKSSNLNRLKPNNDRWNLITLISAGKPYFFQFEFWQLPNLNLMGLLKRAQPNLKTKTLRGGSPGLVVMGGDSCSEGRGFKSRHYILDGHCCKNCNDVCLKKPKINEKRGRCWPIFKIGMWI